MSFSEQWNLSYPVSNDLVGLNSLCVRGRTTSGAGQFELAGQCHTADGTVVRARDIVGRSIRFEIPANDNRGTIRIAAQYPVREIGGKVRINLQDASGARPNIGNLFAALLFLPEVSQIGKATEFKGDGFIEKSYWIDVAGVTVDSLDDTVVSLKLTKLIFATGNKDDETQPSGAMEFDYQKRLSTLFAISELGKSVAAGGVPAALKYYADVLTGKAEFDFSVGLMMQKIITDYLDQQNMKNKRAENDDLVLLQELLNSTPKLALAPKAIREPRNLIFFGAPGTGKSHSLNELSKKFADGHVKRVTFYPDYTYAQFVGCFKPITEDVDDGNGGTKASITYRYVFGPFLETYLQAVKNPDEDFLLIVEEINRANPAAVFGDVFQLLDRKDSGESQYTVATPEEMRRQLEKELADTPACTGTLSIPKNMYIWATMNSADQGVFPMDTAFKRRWDFRYMGIDAGEHAVVNGKKLSEIVVACGGRKVYWNELRKAINRLMIEDCGINEDKLLGPFFLNPSALTDENFGQAFKEKVLLYLFEDAGKTKRSRLFWQDRVTYSQICDKFDMDGESVFGNGLDDKDIFADEGDSADNEATSEE